MLIENDLTRKPQPFIIVAGVRTGGTILTHALDSHPLIHCARGEPWHKHSKWRQVGLERPQIIKLLLRQTGYMASGFKIQAIQLPDLEVLELLKAYQPYIILLSRENILRQAISFSINNQVRRGLTKFVPQHSFEPVPNHSIRLDEDEVLKRCNELSETASIAEELIEDSGLRYISLTYEQLIAGKSEISKLPTMIARQLCLYLGVPIMSLPIFLKRVNWQPLEEIVRNITELEQLVNDR